MQTFLNRIDGIDDAITTLFLSKRTLTRDLELDIRRSVQEHSAHTYDGTTPLGALVTRPDAQLDSWLSTLFKWGVKHITMLRFIDLSFSVYGLHRGGQDDLDAHSYRMHNRIIRSSTRLADFSTGEVSDYYAGKIIPTDVALAYLGITTPEEIEYNGTTYVRATNGYIVKGMEDSRDAKRGLYMLSIPSNFVFRIPLTEFAHVYRERREGGTANPEVKQSVESMVDQVQAGTMGYVTRDVLMRITQ